MALTRISVTVPKQLVAQADRRAKALDRSRSWVVAEALRRYLAGSASQATGRVSEGGCVAYAAAEVAEARRRHLAAELALPPAERLQRAEELGRLARRAQGRRGRVQIVGFESYEDYYEWKRSRLIGA